jgi:hypothetical protein
VALNTPPEEKVAAAVVLEEELDEETQKFIAQSLTDVDLFASYGLTQKAIGLLEAILRRAPRHTPTLEKLLDFVLGAGDDRRTAELSAQLERIHHERGDSAGAERFGELRRRFQRAAGLSDEEMAAAVEATTAACASAAEAGAEEATLEALPIPDAPPVDVATKAVAPAAPVQEVDLSEEWASLLEQAAPAPAAAVAPPPPPRIPAPPQARVELTSSEKLAPHHLRLRRLLHPKRPLHKRLKSPSLKFPWKSRLPKNGL